MELYRSGDCQAAIPQLEQSSNVARSSLPLGRCYLEAADFGKAQAVLSKYRETAPKDEEGAILLARSMELAGSTDPAIALLEQAAKQTPESIRLRDALGDAYAKAGKRQEAKDIYTAVLGVEPADPAALVGLGSLEAAQSRWEAAAELYQRALAASPTNAPALVGMGSAQLSMNKNDAALPYLEKAALARPEDWELAKLLASSQMKAGKWPQVVQTLEFHSLEHSNEQRVTSWMGEAFGHVNEPARAEEYYKNVLKRTPTNLTAVLLLGNLLYDAKRLKESKEQYLAALKLRSDLPEVNDRMGQMAEQDKNLAEAKQYYEAACGSTEATVPMRMRLSRAYFAANEAPKARATLEAVLRAEPANREAKTMLAQVALKTEKWEEAVRLSGELLEEDKKNPQLLRISGEALFHLGRDEDAPKAREALQGVISADPKDRAAKTMLAQIEAKTQQWDEAARYGMELLAVDRNDELVLRLVADAFTRRNRDPEAAEYLEQIVALQENDRATRFRLIDIYRKNENMNRIPRALDLVTAFLKKNPDDPEANLYLGDLLRRKPDLDGAREAFTKGFQTLPPDPPRPDLAWAWSSYGAMLFQDKPEEALPYQTKATELNPKDDRAVYDLAITYLHLRKREDLTATREKLVQMNSPLVSQLDDDIKAFRTAPPRKKK